MDHELNTIEARIRFGATSQSQYYCTLDATPYTFYGSRDERTALEIAIETPNRRRDVESRLLLGIAGGLEVIRQCAATVLTGASMTNPCASPIDGLVRLGATGTRQYCCSLNVVPYLFRKVRDEPSALALVIAIPSRRRDGELRIALTNGGVLVIMQQIVAAIRSWRDAA